MYILALVYIISTILQIKLEMILGVIYIFISFVLFISTVDS